MGRGNVSPKVMEGIRYAMSKNVIYAYVFFVYTLAAISIDIFDKKYGKILMAAIFFAYALLLFVCVHNHFVYDVPVYDYIFVFAQTTIITILTIIAILPIKEKSLSPKQETFLHREIAHFCI